MLSNPFRRPTADPALGLSASLPSTPAILSPPHSPFFTAADYSSPSPNSRPRARSVSPPLPPLPPPRRQESLDSEPPDDPPPAYSLVPTELESSVDFGPLRPFVNAQPQPHLPPRHAPQRQQTQVTTPVSPPLPPPPSRANTHQQSSSDPTLWRRQFDSWHAGASPNPSSLRHQDTGRSGGAFPNPPSSTFARPTSSANNSPRPIQAVFPPSPVPPLPPRNRPPPPALHIPPHVPQVPSVPPAPQRQPSVLRRPATASASSPPVRPTPGPASAGAADRTSRLALALSNAGIETAPQPSTTPIPGRPLMHEGQVLIYPPGFSCPKCHNTGYKSYDPSHPCRKCWARYGKPFVGPLTLAPRSPSFQRPLPKLAAPHHAPAASPIAGLPGAWPESGPRGRYQGQGQAQGFVFPVPAGGGAGGRGGPAGAGGQGLARGRTVRYNVGRPPPGSTVVMPGDPRIGGQLCPGCGGEGVVSVLFFDSETCPVCRGIGRVNV